MGRSVSLYPAWSALAVACALCAVWPRPAWALFADDEARKAIIELRQRVELNRQTAESTHERTAEEAQAVRRSLLELASQIELLRAELARLRGQNEQLSRELTEWQRQQKDLQSGWDDRMRKVEPAAVTVDGQTFDAMPAEKQSFEAAVGTLRRGEFDSAAQAFAGFLRRYPDSGYTPTGLYWLGSADYARRSYKSAIEAHQRLVREFPDHQRVPEALLGMANSQIELKDGKAARRTLEDLIKAHPQSEAAAAARERLKQLR